MAPDCFRLKRTSDEVARRNFVMSTGLTYHNSFLDDVDEIDRRSTKLCATSTAKGKGKLPLISAKCQFFHEDKALWDHIGHSQSFPWTLHDADVWSWSEWSVPYLEARLDMVQSTAQKVERETKKQGGQKAYELYLKCCQRSQLLIWLKFQLVEITDNMTSERAVKELYNVIINGFKHPCGFQLPVSREEMMQVIPAVAINILQRDVTTTMEQWGGFNNIMAKANSVWFADNGHWDYVMTKKTRMMAIASILKFNPNISHLDDAAQRTFNDILHGWTFNADYFPPLGTVQPTRPFESRWDYFPPHTGSSS